jgi:hypothetical protein
MKQRWIVAFALLAPLAASAAAPPTPTAPPAEDLGPLVARLVNDTTLDAASQAVAFRRLMGLGKAGVPYVISHLGDSRRLAEQSIWVHGAPGRDDVQYQPWYVHDGLMAVLKEVTGQAKGPLTGHLLPSQRARNVRKWVTYCASRYPSELTVCQRALQNTSTADGDSDSQVAALTMHP